VVGHWMSISSILALSIATCSGNGAFLDVGKLGFEEGQ